MKKAICHLKARAKWGNHNVKREQTRQNNKDRLKMVFKIVDFPLDWRFVHSMLKCVSQPPARIATVLSLPPLRGMLPSFGFSGSLEEACSLVHLSDIVAYRISISETMLRIKKYKYHMFPNSVGKIKSVSKIISASSFCWVSLLALALAPRRGHLSHFSMPQLQCQDIFFLWGPMGKPAWQTKDAFVCTFTDWAKTGPQGIWSHLIHQVPT